MKKIAILWTGGLDSTYLIIKNLLLGNSVHLYYVDILNNEDDMKAETIARDKLLKDIKKVCKNIDIGGQVSSDIKKLISIELLEGQDYPFPQVPLFFPAILSLIFSFDEIQLGYVYNDYGYVKEFTEGLQTIYKDYIKLDLSEGASNFKVAKLRFPLIEVTKQEEILFFESLDSRYKTHFLKNMIHCENVKEVNGVLSNCNDCKACDNYNNALESLNINKKKQGLKLGKEG